MVTTNGRPSTPTLTIDAPPSHDKANGVHIADKAIDTSAFSLDPHPTEEVKKPAEPPKSILVVDIGGTKVKVLATGHTEPRKAITGPAFTPAKLVKVISKLASDWDYQAISIGYPGLIGRRGPRAEPGNLGSGWVGFDYSSAFGKPVKMMNDAAMQALGGYEGGRMLFIGLGTGVGSALIVEHTIVPLELGCLTYQKNQTLYEALGKRGMTRLGKKVWRQAVNETLVKLMTAFVVDYIVIGGGNAKYVKDLPPGARIGNNLNAFQGGFRIWAAENIWVLAAPGGEPSSVVDPVRVI